jgi:hypothetical protein
VPVGRLLKVAYNAALVFVFSYYGYLCYQNGLTQCLTVVFSIIGCLVLVFRGKVKMSLLLLLFSMATGVVNRQVALYTPVTVDAYLGRLDFGLSRAYYQWSFHHGWFLVVNYCAYISLPLWVGVALAFSRISSRLFTCFLQASLIAPLIYFLVPAVGPAHIGEALAARNCVPSMHMAWALMICWSCSKRFRPLGYAYAIAIASSTIGLGEHYLIDLVAALVYFWLNTHYDLIQIIQRVVQMKKSDELEVNSRPRVFPAAHFLLYRNESPNSQP